MRTVLIRSCALAFIGLFMVMVGVKPASAQTPFVFALEDLPPFNYINEQGIVTGAGVEIARDACIIVQIQCDFQLLPTKRMLAMIKNNRIDGIITVGINESRKNWLHFSKPYTRSEYGFFFNDIYESRIQSVKDLDGFKVMTLVGSNMLATLKKLQQENPDIAFTIQSELTLETAFRKLAYNRYEQDNYAIFANRDVGRYLIKKLEVTNLNYGASQQGINYHFAYPKAKTKERMVQRFDQALGELLKDGRLVRRLLPYEMSRPDQPLAMN